MFFDLHDCTFKGKNLTEPYFWEKNLILMIMPKVTPQNRVLWILKKNCSLVSRFCTIMTYMILLKLHVWEKSLSRVKGATKLYFMHYSCVVIILFSASLCKSAFSTDSIGKTRFSFFCFLVFHVSISLVFIFLFYVLNSMPFQNT